MPESVKDRPTKAHEYLFLLSKSPRYYYDAEAISEPIAGSSIKRYMQNIEAQKGNNKQPGKTNGNMKAALPRFGGGKYGDDQRKEARTKSGKEYIPTLRRNKRDVWTVCTAGYKGAHFATFPEALVRPCILAGSRPGDTVLDPFAGSGTTGAVAVKEGRDFIGIEINPTYSKMSEQRIQEAAQEGAKQNGQIDTHQQGHGMV
jgi:DNA modification methylase